MTNVLIYEDNDKLRDLLTLMFDTTEGFKTAGAFQNPTDILKQIKLYNPDVIIMDIDMPEMNGIQGVSLAKSNYPDIKVIMHTIFDDNERLFASLCNGADGYLLKKDSPFQLINGITEVLDGGAPMSPAIAREVLKQFHKPVKKNEYNISPREKEVLELLAQGFSYRMIGIECTISPETVRRHLKNIYQKLHVQCGTEAVAKAIRERIIAG